MSDQDRKALRKDRTSGKVTMNRRDANRVSVKPAYSSVAVTASGSPERLTGHVYDISEKGLRFEVDRALPVGSAVELELLPLWGEKLPPDPTP